MTFDTGNPGGGRPPGARNRENAYARELYSEKGAAAKKVLSDLVDKADKWAAAYILRQGPRRKGEPIEFDSPPIKTADECSRAMEAVWQAMCRGVLTPEEAKRATDILHVRLRAIEATQLQRQIDELRDAVERQTQLKARVEEALKP